MADENYFALFRQFSGWLQMQNNHVEHNSINAEVSPTLTRFLVARRFKDIFIEIKKVHIC